MTKRKVQDERPMGEYPVPTKEPRIDNETKDGSITGDNLAPLIADQLMDNDLQNETLADGNLADSTTKERIMENDLDDKVLIGEVPICNTLSPHAMVPILDEDFEHLHTTLDMSSKAIKLLSQNDIFNIDTLLSKKSKLAETSLSDINRGTQKKLHKFCMWYEHFYKSNGSDIDWTKHFDEDSLYDFDESKLILNQDLELVCHEMDMTNQVRHQLAKLRITTVEALLGKKEELELYSLDDIKKHTQKLLLKFVIWRKEYEVKHDSADGWQDHFNDDAIANYEPETKVEKDYRSLLDRLHEGQSDGGIGEISSGVSEFAAEITTKYLSKPLREQCINKFNPYDIALSCVKSLVHPTGTPTDVIYLTTGRTQSGKSTVKAVCAAVHRQFNCLLIIITKGVAERDDLKIKLNRLLGGCRETKDAGLIVIADTAAQIARATRRVQDLRKQRRHERFGIIVDECDAMYRTTYCEQQMEQRYKDLMELKPSFRMEISATIFSAIQTLSEQGKDIELMGITTTDEYSGIHQMKHLHDRANGKEIYLKESDLNFNKGVRYSVTDLKSLSDKFYTEVLFTEDKYPDCDDCNTRSGCMKHTDIVSTRWAACGNCIPYSSESVIELLNQALETNLNRKGTLVLVATNPRVYAEGNVMVQATCFQNYFRKIDKDFTALVATGRGTYFRLPGYAKGRFIRRNRKTISEVIEVIDKKVGLETPVVVFGYSRLCRCVSFRSNGRVPTHIVLTRGPGTSLEDYIQALGRATFNGLSTLKENGYENVTVLTNIQDFTAAKKYYIFIDTFIKMLNNDPSMKPSEALKLTSVKVKLPDEANFFRHTNRKIGRNKDLKKKCPGQNSFETPTCFEYVSNIRDQYLGKPLPQKVLMIIRELSEGDDEFYFSCDDILNAFANGDDETYITKAKLKKLLRDFESNIILVKHRRGDCTGVQWSVKNMDVLHYLINDNLKYMVKEEEIFRSMPSLFDTPDGLATL